MLPFLGNQPLAPSSSKPGMMCADLSFFWKTGNYRMLVIL